MPRAATGTDAHRLTAPKSIATDLDGALLDSRGRLSERDQKALQSAREHGILTVAVTARPARAAYRVPELAAVLDAALCSTGAIPYDPATRAADLRQRGLADRRRAVEQERPRCQRQR